MDRDDIYSMLNSEPVCNQSSAIGHSHFEARAILVAPTFSRQSLFKLMFTCLSEQVIVCIIINHLINRQVNTWFTF